MSPSAAPTDLQPLIDAATGKHWLVLGALVVGLVVAAAKQGWLSTWLANRLPAWSLPWLALGLSTSATMSAEVTAGKTWQQALWDGFTVAALAIMGHQVGIEGMRAGRELIPTTKAVAAGDGPKANLPPPDAS